VTQKSFSSSSSASSSQTSGRRGSRPSISTTILFNQFHDILPGSSIEAVYEDAREDYGFMFDQAGSVIDGALSLIAGEINTLLPGETDSSPLSAPTRSAHSL